MEGPCNNLKDLGLYLFLKKNAGYLYLRMSNIAKVISLGNMFGNYFKKGDGGPLALIGAIKFSI